MNENMIWTDSLDYGADEILSHTFTLTQTVQHAACALHFVGSHTRTLQKGTCFDSLTQEQINLALSHLNSYSRESLGGKTPYDLFIEKYGVQGKTFLDAINIVRIPSNQVTLHPFLLGQKYQRVADKAILKKNGVI